MAREMTDAEVFGSREMTDAEVFGSASVNPARAKAKAILAKNKPTLLQNATGFLANVNRGLGIGDEVAAGFDTAATALSDGLSGRQGPNILDRYRASMSKQRAIEDGYMRDNRVAANLARGTGMAATALLPTSAATSAFANSSRLANAARGATVGGLWASGASVLDRGSAQERLQAASDTARNPLALGLGAASGALAPARAALPKPPKPQGPGDVLGKIGVETSIPQRAGGQAKSVEDIMARFPIMQQGINGARSRQVEQLNRGIGLKALEPIGEKLPADIKPGFEMVQHIEQKLSDTYNRAMDLVPQLNVDQQFYQDLGTIMQRRTDLPESGARQFENIVQDRLKRLDPQNGPTTGNMIKQIHSELGGLQAEAARKGEMTLSGMLEDTRKSLMDLVGRTDPTAGELIDKADQGWQIYSILNDAAGAATNRGGVFLPGQLNTQVGRAAQRLGPNFKGKGLGPMQDIATAASQLIPDSYGNPGTANALLMGGGAGAMVANPAVGIPLAIGATAVATPYFMMGRKILEQLPPNASPIAISKAQRLLDVLVSKDPNIVALQRELAMRGARTSGLMNEQPDQQPTY